MNNQLVSVLVGTYNSAQYIEETLESVYNQSYENIELIVTDDCSTDNTIEIVKNWIEEHRKRFKNCKIIKSGINTGVPANVNRGIKASEGEWLKFFAGDDIMLPECISTYITFIRNNPEYDVLFSRIRHFRVKGDEKIYITDAPSESYNNIVDTFNRSDAHDQFLSLLRDGCFLPAPSCICRASLMKKYLFNEKYKFEEDYPMWLHLTFSGCRIHILPAITVLYRRGNSLSSRSVDYYSRKYMMTRALFFWDKCFEYYKEENEEKGYNKYRKLLLKYELAEGLTWNRKNKWNSLKILIINKFVNKFIKFELY